MQSHSMWKSVRIILRDYWRLDLIFRIAALNSTSSEIGEWRRVCRSQFTRRPYRKFKIVGEKRRGVSSEAARQVGFFFDEKGFRWIETNKFRPWQKKNTLMWGLIASVWLPRRTGKPNLRIPCSWKPHRNNERRPGFLPPTQPIRRIASFVRIHARSASRPARGRNQSGTRSCLETFRGTGHVNEKM